MSKIVFIGDSITKGIGYGSVTVTDAFAHKVGISAGYAADNILNKGVSSDKTSGVLARLADDVLANAPDVCVIMIGANDWIQGVPVATYISNMRDIIGQIRGAGIRPVVLSTVPYRGSNAQFDTLAAQVEALEDLVADLGVDCVDVHRDVMMWYWRKGSAVWGALYADANIHLSKAGHQWVADKLMRPCYAPFFAPGTVVVPDPVDPPTPDPDHLALTLALADLALGTGALQTVQSERAKFQ